MSTHQTHSVRTRSASQGQARNYSSSAVVRSADDQRALPFAPYLSPPFN